MVSSAIRRPKQMLVALIEETLLGASSALSVGMFKLPAVLLFPQDRYKDIGRLLSLKSLRWENFRWTGLGQKT
jgi:hypothetical protein